MEPTFLVAAPQMHDALFERTVVLVWSHDEDGAIGVVVNKPIDHKLVDVVRVDEGTDLSPYAETVIAWGGPVEVSSGTVVTKGQVSDEEGWMLPDGLAVTRSQDALARLIAHQEPVLLCLGYAGWGPGQLEREIEQGGWLFADLDAELVFATPAEERYRVALASLGLTEHSLVMGPAEA
jgi:putative transcriptional regulator